MSVIVEGVVDLPFTDLTDTITIKDLLYFLHENGVIELQDWLIEEEGEKIMLTHKSRRYSWIELSKDGRIRLDKHYRETETFKDRLLQVINEYYPSYKKALEIIEKIAFPTTGSTTTKRKKNSFWRWKMPKVVLEIDKEGKVELRGEGYKEDECLKSPKLQKLLRSIDEVDTMKKLYEQKQKEVESYEELI